MRPAFVHTVFSMVLKEFGLIMPLHRKPWQRWRPRSAQQGGTEVPRSHETTRPRDKWISLGRGVSEFTIRI